jgi:hypothetical protein
VKAGERSGQRLYASLPADGEEYQIFRHVGFTAYAQEDVYKLMSPPSGLEGVEPLPVRRQHIRDSWELQQLYATVTPRAVQNAEGSAQSQCTCGKVKTRFGPRSRFVLATLATGCVCFYIPMHWIRLTVW